MAQRKCRKCPAFFQCNSEDLAVTGGGWEKKQIDGKQVMCCRPGMNPSKKRKMQQFSYYCLVATRGKKIGSMADWTGRTPAWCPLGRELEDVHENS